MEGSEGMPQSNDAAYPMHQEEKETTQKTTMQQHGVTRAIET